MKLPSIDTPKYGAPALPFFLSKRGADSAWYDSAPGERSFSGKPPEKKSGQEPRPARSIILPAHIVAKALETPVLNILLPVAAGFSPDFSSEVGKQAADSGHAVLIYCSRGRGWCDLRGRRHKIEAGQVLIISPGVTYTLGTDAEDTWSISWARIAGVKLPFFLEQIGITDQMPLIDVIGEAQLAPMFDDLLHAMEEGCSPVNLLQSAQIVTQLLELLAWHHRAQAFGEAEAAQKIRQSIDYMRQRLHQSLQVSALAAQVNISQSHYFALFKRLTGSTPIDYFIRLRMRYACTLLNDTSASVKGVAAQLGYDDPFYFSRLFRLVHGIAPSDYRKLSSGNNGAARGCRVSADRNEADPMSDSSGPRNPVKASPIGEDSP